MIVKMSIPQFLGPGVILVLEPRHIALDQGDLISTGTPEGIGLIREGETVSCTVEKIGTLSNPVRYR
jgi:hypothetical protein